MKYSNYDYKKKDQLLPSSPKMSPCLKGDKISPALIRLLYLGENEEILFYKSLNLRKFKNGKNIFRKLLVITPVNLILASYKSFYIPMPNPDKPEPTGFIKTMLQ